MPRRPQTHRPAKPIGMKTDRKERERKKFYDGTAWRKCRASFLSLNPLCRYCLDRGLETEATIAHHDKERLDRPDLAFDHDNLVALCSPCHTRYHKVY